MFTLTVAGTSQINSVEDDHFQGLCRVVASQYATQALPFRRPRMAISSAYALHSLVERTFRRGDTARVLVGHTCASAIARPSALCALFLATLPHLPLQLVSTTLDGSLARFESSTIPYSANQRDVNREMVKV